MLFRSSSMEVYVRVFAHDLLKDEKKLTTDAFVTMVALNEKGEPIPVRKVHPETEEDRKLFEGAPKRREIRKQRLKERNNKM